MLNLLFVEKLNEEQDNQIFQILSNNLLRYEHNVFESGRRCDLKVTVYAINKENGRQIMKELTEKGFRFGYYYSSGDPFLTENVVKMEDGEWESLPDESMKEESAAIERKFMVGSPLLPPAANSEVHEVKPLRMVAGNNQESENFAAPESPESPPMTPTKSLTLQESVLARKLAEIEKTQQVIVTLMSSMESRIGTAQSAPVTPMAPAPSSSKMSARNMAQSEEYKAKHELLANGLRCDMCTDVIRAGELAALLNAVRDHVIGHFDRENPRFKRFHCKVCKNPPMSTNFVDEFERHVKKHGGSAPETRNKITDNQTTKPYLKLVCEFANKCFSEVFEKTPPEISQIKAIDTPSNAKTSIFPALDALFCMKYRVPVTCRGRKSVPTAFVTLN